VPDAYLELSADEQKEILQSAASELGKHEAILEKDIWVCWALQTVFSIPDTHPMAFKGGTSLSKIYNIIDRFSEDVDITLDYRHFGEQFNPFETGMSKNQIKKFSDRLKAYVKEYANDIVIPFINSELKKFPFGSEQSISIDDNGEKIWVSYPSVIEKTDEYMKSEILIELGL